MPRSTEPSQNPYLQDNGKPAGNYTCDNGKKLESGKLVCPEESLIANDFLAPLRDLFNRPDFALWIGEAKAWNSSIGYIYDIINNIPSQVSDFYFSNCIINTTPLNCKIYKAGKETVAKYSSKFFIAVMQFLVPSPISANMSGARSFNMLAAGADESSRAFCTDTVGCKNVSAEQAAQIRQSYAAEEKASFRKQPFMARMFDTGSQYSLVSRVAMAMPTDKAAISQKVSSFLSKPLNLLNVVGSLWSKPAVAADVQPDPFGIPQTAYPNDDPVFNADPEALTDDVCKQINKVWQSDDHGPVQIAGFTISGMKEDPATGMPINDSTNPCMINDTAIGSAGGWYSDGNLDSQDLTDKPAGSDNHFAQNDLKNSDQASNSGIAYKDLYQSSPAYQTTVKLGDQLSGNINDAFKQTLGLFRKIPLPGKP